jgi:ABC-type glycerol-3-phosphate transport system permease component
MRAALNRPIRLPPLESRIVAVASYVLLVAIAFVVLLPLIWMVSTSLKTQGQVFSTPIEWIPSNPMFSNYPNAYGSLDFTKFFINSIVVATTAMVIHVFLASLAGYGLAKYRFVGRRWLLVLILASLMLPIEVIMVPLYLTVRDLGWLNSYQGLIVPHIADAFGVFLMRQYFVSLPDALIEAARIDGAGHLRTFLTIALPLSKPAIATLAIFSFRETWDEFLWPFLVVSSGTMRTVPLGVQSFQAAELANFPFIMAISTLATVPLVILFVVFQRQFVRGVQMTGLRE